MNVPKPKGVTMAGTSGKTTVTETRQALQALVMSPAIDSDRLQVLISLTARLAVLIEEQSGSAEIKESKPE